MEVSVFSCWVADLPSVQSRSVSLDPEQSCSGGLCRPGTGLTESGQPFNHKHTQAADTWRRECTQTSHCSFITVVTHPTAAPGAAAAAHSSGFCCFLEPCWNLHMKHWENNRDGRAHSWNNPLFLCLQDTCAMFLNVWIHYMMSPKLHCVSQTSVYFLNMVNTLWWASFRQPPPQFLLLYKMENR